MSLIFAFAACTRSNPAPVEHKGLAEGQPAGKERPSATGAAGASGAFVVSKGDTIWGIARITGVPVRTIISANALEPPFTLFSRAVPEYPLRPASHRCPG